MNVSLNEVINPSIFETNKYLIDNNNLTLVNYAAFNGSSKIFHYLMSENVEFSKDDILYYAIHGNNQEIIKYLEDNFVKLSEIKDRYFIEESIMCHRNDIVKINKNFKPENKNITTAIISSYNYELIEIDYFAKFPELFVRYDYSESLYYLLNSQKVDVNQIFVRPNGENTLLSIACKNDCVEIANLLSKRPEIDPNIRLYQLKDVETTFDNIDIQYTNQFDYITLLVLVFVFLPYVLTSNIYMKIMALIMLISYLCILVKFKILTRICRFVKAAFHGYNVTKLLLSCLLNFDDTSALSLAIVNNQSEIVKILLENPKICVNKNDLDDAAENCFIEIIPVILSKLNSEDSIYPSNENSLLSAALKFKNEEVTQLLLKMNGVDKLD